MSEDKIMKVTWAINVFDDLSQHSQLLYLLGALDRSRNIEIHPIFIMSPAVSHVPYGPFFDYQKDFEELAHVRFAKWLKEIKFKEIKNLKVLVSQSSSIKRTTLELLSELETEKTDLIVVATHSRKGLSRFLLGSFTETLILQSEIPVFTVNPETKVRERISRIMFPTDFHPRFRSAFEEIVSLCKSFEAELTLFYKEPLIESAYLYPTVYKYLEEEAIARIQRAEEWRTWAEFMGVQVHLELDRNPGSLVPSLLERAERENIDLIAVSTESDTLSTFLLGSATRSIVRGANCPVWVMRNKGPLK